MTTRQLIVIDTETSGLNLLRHHPIEIAAVNVATRKELYFVPTLPPGVIDQADGDALQINRYFERGVHKHAGTEASWWRLWQMLEHNTLAGSNPAFDSIMLLRGYTNHTGAQPKPSWHHRLADLAAYAAPYLGLQPYELEGLAHICDRLGVKNDEQHTALADARATAECFRILTKKYGKGTSL